jgi:hypothetical protein
MIKHAFVFQSTKQDGDSAFHSFDLVGATGEWACNLACRAYSARMKTSKLILTIAVVSFLCAGIAAADPLAPAVMGKTKKGDKEKLVFVTGSRIPKRVTVKAIGTDTTSPVRVYTRAEIDRTGRFTTQGILAQDPSITIIGSH